MWNLINTETERYALQEYNTAWADAMRKLRNVIIKLQFIKILPEILIQLDITDIDLGHIDAWLDF